MAEELDDAWLKLDRAGEHIQALKAEIRRFGDGRPYRVTGDADVKSREYVLRIKPKEPPKRVGVLIGDVLANLRPSLDYLIGALAILDSGKAHGSNQFPICDTPTLFKGELAKGRLAGVSTAHIALIEKLQPYPRRKGKVWLRLLREYSNPDKHRHLNVLLTHIEGDFSVPPRSEPPPLAFRVSDSTSFDTTPGWQFSPPEGEFGHLTLGSAPTPSDQFTLVPSVSFGPGQITGAQITGAPIAEAKQPPPKRNVHVELEVAVNVAFPDGTPVVETMEIFESQISQVLNAFERQFET